MVEIRAKRLSGNGVGITIGFPTVNSYLDKLPNDIEIGLYASIINGRKSLTLISKNKKRFRLETNCIDGNIYVNHDQFFKLVFLKKVREYKRITNVEKQIVIDKGLVNDYFDNVKSCLSCKYCFIQDEGYSNYTVTDSYYGCFDGVFTRLEELSISDDIIKADKCGTYINGEIWEFDVDGEVDMPNDSFFRDLKINKILTDEI